MQFYQETTVMPPRLCVDGWTSMMVQCVPNLTLKQASDAVDAVLGALIDNLPISEVRALDASLCEGMKSRLRAIAVRRAGGRVAGDESLVNVVAERLPASFPHHACLITRLVLAVMAERIPPEAVGRLASATPERWRKLWPKSGTTIVAGMYT